MTIMLELVLLCVDLLAVREDFQAAALKRTAMLVCWIVRIA